MANRQSALLATLIRPDALKALADVIISPDSTPAQRRLAASAVLRACNKLNKPEPQRSVDAKVKDHRAPRFLDSGPAGARASTPPGTDLLDDPTRFRETGPPAAAGSPVRQARMDTGRAETASSQTPANPGSCKGL